MTTAASPRWPVRAATALLAAVFVPGLYAQDQSLTYQAPPQVVVDLVDAPVTPAVELSPDRGLLLLMDRPPLPSIADLSQPELRLGGLRVNPATNGASRQRYFDGLRLLGVDGGEERRVTGLPENPRLGNVRWSPDGERIAFTHTADSGVELWVAEVASARAARLAEVHVNEAAYGAGLVWHPDGRSLYVRIVPPGRGPAPVRDPVPAGPVVQENLGRAAPARTFQDLLTDAHDEELFDHYFTSRIARVALDGSVRTLGEAATYTFIEPSPDGRFLLVNRIERPYSYLVPAFRFPLTTEVWDENGRVAHVVAERPLADEVPIGVDAAMTGPRSVSWRHDAPATLVWVEAQDGGDPRSEAEVRDRVFLLAAPFREPPRELAATAHRVRGVVWGSDDLALLYERWFNTRTERAWVVSPGSPEAEARLLYERSYEDRYNDPGQPMLVPNEAGRPVLFTADAGRTLYFRGEGASPEGNRPFVDRLDLETGETTRLWRSEPPHYEFATGLLDGDGRRLLTMRESRDVQPNLFSRDLGSGELRQLTEFPHPTPELRGVHRELIAYEREDGLPLSGTLYLPAGYDPARNGPLPLMVWAYPREFLSADAAGQVTDSPHRFTRLSFQGPHFLVTQGYAVLDNATMPVVGEDGQEPNDTFVEQLVANAAAAIDAVVERGIADPDRVAVGGHSYGAFMTANLLAHSDLFRAGIARSGAYNRSLTPFGFQFEQRTLWEAPEVYTGMSPFFHAHRIRSPILLIHGAADNNSGTFPMQSERLYQALRGLGGTARLVMLPHESHGYQARESVLHVLWETLAWLDTYVKHAPERERVTATPEQ